MLSDELPPDRLVTLVELAEGLGYRELWLTDQRFWRDCYMGLTLAARHSERLLLGPGVNDPFTRHPATIAMAIATLDELSGGRAQLGIGVGGSGIREMRLPRVRPVRALQEAIELIRAMLPGDIVHFEGETFHLDGGKLGFKPVSPDIPIYVATHSPQVLRLCGRLGVGVLLGNVATSEGLAAALTFLREREANSGRLSGSSPVNLRLEACISDDEPAAINAMKRRFAVRLLQTAPHWDYLDRLGIVPTSGMSVAAESANLDAMLLCLDDRAVRATALVGSPQSVIQQLVPLLEHGIDQLTIRPYPCAGQDLDQTIVAFANEVWPAINATVVAQV
jgi:5,10-methylenetetrahydromethanopterin reductase